MASRATAAPALAGVVVILHSFVSPLAAQDVVRGRVADAADNPIPGVVVLLHAITEAGGSEIDRDTADAGGGFELSFDFQSGPLYFVATRVEGQIFMADPFRALPDEAIVLRAGPGVEPLSLDALAASPTDPAAAAPADERAHEGWWVAAIAAVIVGAVSWLVQRTRGRAPRARELLLEIARLDEAHAASPGSEEAYHARRNELRARLDEALELDPHADRH